MSDTTSTELERAWNFATMRITSRVKIRTCEANKVQIRVKVNGISDWNTRTETPSPKL